MIFLFKKKNTLSKKYSVPFSSVLKNAITMQATQRRFSFFKKVSWTIKTLSPAI